MRPKPARNPINCSYSLPSLKNLKREKETLGHNPFTVNYLTPIDLKVRDNPVLNIVLPWKQNCFNVVWILLSVCMDTDFPVLLFSTCSLISMPVSVK